MDAPTILDRPHAGLLAWLAAHGIDHEIHQHDETFTARQTARAEGVSSASFAKVIAVRADDGRLALIVVDASDDLDLRKARDVLGTTGVRLLTETELGALTPGCDLGAVPAVGVLFGLPLYADVAVRDEDAVSFNAGSHRFAVRVDRVTWERAADVAYANLAIDQGRGVRDG